MTNSHGNRMVKRLNATLPDPLALHVGKITDKGALYEVPGEFIRDPVRRHMEKSRELEREDIHSMLSQSLRENDYADWTNDDLTDARKLADE